ncbi:MAG: DUF4190 domain-containing protein [Clostridiales bacterium]|nr:DUF4190 domain-containing protein [Clostridiales bacterium]
MDEQKSTNVGENMENIESAHLQGTADATECADAQESNRVQPNADIQENNRVQPNAHMQMSANTADSQNGAANLYEGRAGYGDNRAYASGNLQGTMPQYHSNHSYERNMTGYGQQPPVQQKADNGFGIASMVLGIVSLVLGCTCANWLTGICAIVFGILQLTKREPKEKAPAIAGIVTAAISMLISIVLIFLWLLAFKAESQGNSDFYRSYYYDNYEAEEKNENEFLSGSGIYF